MLADDIATYLAGAGLGLSMGSSSNGIFSTPFPTEAGETATCVIEYGGEPPLRAMGPALTAPVVERPRFQVVSRDASDNAMTCRSLQKDIWNKLEHHAATLAGATGGTTVYHFIEALSSPSFLKLDESGRVYYACNFRAQKAPTA